MAKTSLKLNRNTLLIALLLVITVGFIAYNFKVFTTNNSIVYTDADTEVQSYSITDNKFQQQLIADEPIRAIELVLLQDTIQGPTRMAMTLYQSSTNKKVAYCEKTFDLSDLATKVRFEFPDTESFSVNEYYFTLESLDKGRKINVNINAREYQEHLIVKGEKYPGRLIFTAYYSNNLLFGFLCLTTILLVISLLFLLLPHQIMLRPEDMFFLLALVCGLTIAFISPSGQEPDGGDHILRAFDVSYGNLSQKFDGIVQFPDNFGKFDDSIVQPGLNQGLARSRTMMNVYFNPDLATVHDYEYKSAYAVFTYFPQGFGLYLGRVFGLNAWNMLALARIVNLLFYILVSYYAIRHIPSYKNLLLVIALLPMSVFQASSLSADPMINGFSFLFIALILGIQAQKTPVRLTQLILPALLLYICYVAKPAYIMLGLLVLIIPFSKYPKLMTRVLRIIAAIAVIGAFFVFVFGFASGKLMLAEGKAAYETQMDFVTHNILQTLRIFLHTLNANFLQNITWLNMLGWINYNLGPLVILVPAFIILVGVLDQDDRLNFNAFQKTVVWAAFAGCLAAIYIGLYIFDSKNNSIAAPLMVGVQGRYLIPFMILPFVALKNQFKIVKGPYFSQRTAGITGLMLVYTLVTLIQMIY